MDYFGRLIKVEEYKGIRPCTLYATTNYGYDEQDLFKMVTDAASNGTTRTYDGFRRKIEMFDYDAGTNGCRTSLSISFTHLFSNSLISL